ncbi:hypothetical protein ACFLY4_09895, partial [Chloroflexota bacterium]
MKESVGLKGEKLDPIRDAADQDREVTLSQKIIVSYQIGRTADVRCPLLLYISHQVLVLICLTCHIFFQGLARVVVLEGLFHVVLCDFHVGIEDNTWDWCAIEQVYDLAHTPSRGRDGGVGCSAYYFFI